MNFEACLLLPRDPREAGLIADNLEALASALREWPVDAWQQLLSNGGEASKPGAPSREGEGLFERLLVRTAPAAIDTHHRGRALESAEAVASVLRVLWPEAQQPKHNSEDSQRLLLSAKG